MIEDVLIIIANIILCTSPLPSIFSSNKPDKKTDILNIVVCPLFMVAYIRLGLYWAVLFNFLIMTMWSILLFQSIKKDKSPVKWKKPFDLKTIDDNMDLLDGID